MPFVTDTKFARAVKDSYGDYLATFESDHHQVRADIFKQGDWLVAHISSLGGLKFEEVTDRYLGEIRSFAKDRGFDGKLRIMLS